MSGREHLVVIGNGMVGLEFLIQAVRRGLNIRYRMSVFGDERAPAYDRIRLTETMNGAKPEDLTLQPRSWYSDNGIELTTDALVTHIDRDAQTITTSDGTTHSYNKLVLATGSRPFVPPIDGADSEGVFTYRTLDDIAAIQTACQSAPDSSSAVIIGGGLLGLELAKAVQEQGLATTVVEFAPGLMVRQLNPVASNILQTQIERLGMKVRVETQTTAIIPKESAGFSVSYADGTVDTPHLVVIATGIRPRDDLAVAAGLRCSPRGGVVVDNYLTTSDDDIYAIGECAIHDGRVYGLAAPGYHMAEILAKRLNQAQLSAFKGFDLSTRLKLAGLDVWTIGDYQGSGDPSSWRRDQDYRQLIMRDGHVVGATIIGAWDELALMQDAVARRIELSATQLKRFTLGEPVFGEDLDSPVHWPEQAIVCTCMQVTRGTITQAIDGGCKTIEAVSEQTSAGTVCGTCRPIIGELTGSAIPEEALISHGNKTLLRCSVIAGVMVIPFALFDIPYDDSIVNGSGIDVLWRSSLLKQITGYTTLGISVLALLLSLRKRVVNVGNYGWWRAIHAFLGMLALGGLIAHTGMRLGANLNFALSLSFLGVALIGSTAGAISALENRIGGRRIRTLRLWWTRAHIALVWLFLPLVTFHIIKVYSY